MKTIRGLLDAAIGGGGVTIPAHGAFWRIMNPDQFVAAIIFGEQQIKTKAGGGFHPVLPHSSQHWERVCTLSERCWDAGRDPAGRAAMLHDQVATIRAWIIAGRPA
jgi:hypothetical protein